MLKFFLLFFSLCYCYNYIFLQNVYFREEFNSIEVLNYSYNYCFCKEASFKELGCNYGSSYHSNKVTTTINNFNNHKKIAFDLICMCFNERANKNDFNNYF